VIRMYRNETKVAFFVNNVIQCNLLYDERHVGLHYTVVCFKKLH